MKKYDFDGKVEQIVLLDVPSYNQQQLGYPTGCEIVALAMMLNYKSNACIKELFSKMPLNNDPNKGYRGDPATDGGFTIFPGGLLDLTAQYVSPCDMSGCEIYDLKEKLKSGIPIVAWVSGLGFGVHAICLSGYDEEGFYYNDPWTGEKDAFLMFEAFYEIWNKPIYDLELKLEYPSRKALSYI